MEPDAAAGSGRGQRILAVGAFLLLLLACNEAASDRLGGASGEATPADRGEAVEPAPEPTQGALPRARISVGIHVFDVEIADTDERKARGLGGHAPLQPAQGMIFAYERAGLYGYWMQDMRFDIDIIWIRGDRVVGVEHEVPHQPSAGRPPIYRPPEPVDLVLEVAAGVARSKGIGPGDPVAVEPEVRGTRAADVP